MTKTRLFFVLLASGICGYLIIMNTAPVTMTHEINSRDRAVVSGFYPAKRISTDGSSTKLLETPIYLDHVSSFNYDRASVAIKFKNPTNESLSIGYRDRQEWHYDTKVISAPFIDQLKWHTIGEGPYIYQKADDISSVEKFIRKPPANKVIGYFDYNIDNFIDNETIIKDYKPAPGDTVIDHPVRGKITMYVYLKGEPFKFSLTKKDLNWYEDPDPVKITISKGNDVVMTGLIDDDGNNRADKQEGIAQTIHLHNPGPGLPEAGVYKIVIDASRDVAITNMTTNLHKIVFAGTVMPINNSRVYGSIAVNNEGSTLYTSSSSVALQTFHEESLQAITSGDTSVELAMKKEVVEMLVPQGEPLIMPQSNTIVSGAGYFAFSKQQLFEPTTHQLRPIIHSSDIQHVDYILTNYKSANAAADGWYHAKNEFDLTNAVIIDNKLSWALFAAESKNGTDEHIQIKDLEIKLTKYGWFVR